MGRTRAAPTPKEFAELAGEIHHRGHRVFLGAYDQDAEPVGFMERLTRMMPASLDGLPVGNFRDWPDIEAWAGASPTGSERLRRRPSGYALCVVAASQSSAPSIGIDFHPGWVRVSLTPVGRAKSPRMPHLSRPGWSNSPIYRT